MPRPFSYNEFSRSGNRGRPQRKIIKKINSNCFRWFGWAYQVTLWTTLILVGFYAWNGQTISYFADTQTLQAVGINIPYQNVPKVR